MRMAACLIDTVWPDHGALFRCEMQAYRSFGDVFDTYFAWAEVSGDVVGFSLLAASMMALDLDTLLWVAVHPAFRGQGIGKRVVGRCLQEARRRGKPVALTTSVPVFYEKMGFGRRGSYDSAQEHFLMTTA